MATTSTDECALVARLASSLVNIYMSSAQPWAPVAPELQNFDKNAGLIRTGAPYGLASMPPVASTGPAIYAPSSSIRSRARRAPSRTSSGSSISKRRWRSESSVPPSVIIFM